MSACFCRLAFDMIRKLAYYDETFLASTHQNSQWSCNLDPNLSKLANLNPKWPERTVMCFKIAWFDQTSSSQLGTSSKFDSVDSSFMRKAYIILIKTCVSSWNSGPKFDLESFQVQIRNCLLYNLYNISFIVLIKNAMLIRANSP